MQQHDSKYNAHRSLDPGGSERGHVAYQIK